MSIIQSIILGVIQGITEFLPISSSGHLAIFQNIFKLKESPIFFDTLVHMGTLIAVIFYLRKEILHILKTVREKQTIKIIFLIALATIPAIFVGLFLESRIESIFSSMFLVAFSLLITSAILFTTVLFKNCNKKINDLKWYSALFIGIFQAFAILPGVSRSGSTISASMFSGLKKEEAFKFSFLLSIPIIFGAFLLQLSKQDFAVLNGEFWPNFLGFILSVIFGLISLKIIEKVIINGKIHYFGFYTLALGVIMLILI